MKKIFICSSVLSSIFLFSVFAVAQKGELKIVKLQSPANKIIIPWMLPTNKSWKAGTPLFKIKNEAGTEAKGWVGLTNEYILLRVEVKDDIHQNEKTEAAIYDGDGIQIGIDARGDGSLLMDKNTKGPFGPDDAALGFALTKKGTEGYTFFSSVPKIKGSFPVELINISRDENKKITFYEIKLPWRNFNTSPGLYPEIGIAVQINDTDPGKDQARLYYGRGADGYPRPGLFEKLLLGNPPENCTASTVEENEIWDQRDAAKILFAVASNQDYVIKGEAGMEKTEELIKGDAKRTIQRYSLSFLPKTSAEGQSISGQLLDSEKKNILSLEKTELIIPETTYQNLINRINKLDTGNIHPLMQRHLQSVKSLIQNEWSRLTLYKNYEPRLAKETFKYFKNILAGFNSDAGNWETYLDGKRTLFMSFISKKDGSVQYYMFTLPKNWDPNKPYPMFVELHGAGNPHPLAPASAQLGFGESALDLSGYSSPKSFAMIQRNGYHVQPFGRGNNYYKGIAETDVWEAIEDVSANFKIDEDRRYLYGFSMGGGGTLSIGLRTPDYWAAMALYSPAGSFPKDHSSVPELGKGLMKNISYLPTWMWIGDKDYLFFNFIKIKTEMMETGLKPVITVVPNIGHNYLASGQEEGLNWMQQYTRKRPDTFTFTADTDEHRGVWGIIMTRDLTISGLPNFTCSIEGQTVKLETQGTPEVEINLGENGLNMKDNVTVVLNGNKAYEGPAQTVKLQTEKK